jgi:macrolide transport system ATP-binding/permease protein
MKIDGRQNTLVDWRGLGEDDWRERGVEMDGLWKDLKYAGRMLAKKPVFTAVAVLSLAFGIGANTTIFTLIKAVFLQSLPVRDSSRVVAIFGTTAHDKSPENQFSGVSVPNLLDYRKNLDVFSATSIVYGGEVAIDASGKTIPAYAQLVNWDFFNALGVQPLIGRGFAREDDEAAHPVIVLSNVVWQRYFGGRRDAIGQNVRIGAQDFSIIGVMPPDFHDVGAIGTAEAWIPESMHDAILTDLAKEWFTRRASMMGIGVARLKPGVTFARAQQAMDAIGERLEHEYPDDNADRRAALVPIDETTVPADQRSLYIRAGALMMIVVGLVLLIACANVANLLLARATQRRREVAIRLSLGASRGRLIRQMLTESLLLGTAGAALAMLFAKWVRPAFLGLLPGNNPGNLDVRLDLRVFAFTLALALAATILFGLAPAIQASNPKRVSALHDRTDAPSGTNRWYGLRSMLVTAQVAFSLIALIGAALFLHSLRNAREVNPGFDVSHSVLILLDTKVQGYTQARAEQFYSQVLDRVRALPGISAAGVVDRAPLTGGLGTLAFRQDADASNERNGEATALMRVSPGYFGTAGIALLRGRDFNGHDDADSQKVLIVNQTIADRMWPGQDPIGQQVRFYKRPWILSVVGVVKTVKYQSLGEPPEPAVYMPLKQLFNWQVFLWARSSGGASKALPEVQAAVQSLAPAFWIGWAGGVQELVDKNLSNATLAAELLGAFGLLALILAAIGTCGVTYYAVSQRTREIGVRMALGASPRDVLRLILGGAMGAVAGGVAVGMIVSVFLARTVGGFLYGIKGFDSVSFAAASVMLIVVALVACLFPAMRAMRVDPMVALRHE